MSVRGRFLAVGVLMGALCVAGGTQVSAASCAGTPLTGADAGKFGIASRADLEAIDDTADSLDCSYVVTADIDLSGSEWKPIGNDDRAFTGTFDGANHSITGITYDDVTTNYAGLFGVMRNAKVTRVNVSATIRARAVIGGLVGLAEDSTISHVSANVALTLPNYAWGRPWPPTGAQAGGIVGELTRSTLTRAKTTGTISGAGSQAGGLAAEVFMSTVATSRTNVKVNAYQMAGGAFGSLSKSKIMYVFAEGDVSGHRWVGGFAAFSCSTDVTNSYANGDVTGVENAGGFIEDIVDTEVVNVYSTGKVTAPTASGLINSLADWGEAENIVTNSFWNPTDSGTDTSAAGEEATQAEMKNIKTYADADWTIVEGWLPFDPPDTRWGICDGVNNGYPFLLWAYDTNPCAGPDGLIGTPDDVIATTTDVENGGQDTQNNIVPGVTGAFEVHHTNGQPKPPASVTGSLPATGGSPTTYLAWSILMMVVGLGALRIARRFFAVL